jgi:nucleoside phosphorylase
MIGIVTALPKEYAAVETMLDNCSDYNAPGQGAGRRYRMGQVPASGGGAHRIALALADMGNNMAAIRAGLLLQHFPHIQHVIMVGIAAGVPHPKKPDDHVRLGDIVVSDKGGVIQYDFDKEEYDFKEKKPLIKRRFPPRPPSATLLEAVKLLSAAELSGQRPWLGFISRADHLENVKRPPDETDRLLASDGSGAFIAHPSDPNRTPGQPRVFLGPIASANKLLKNPVLRDELRDQYGVKAAEMEGSGIADATWNHEVGYLVARGICDYGDALKNDDWQGYAAVVAAAYVRALLESMPATGENDDAPFGKPDKPMAAFNIDMRGSTVGEQKFINGDYIDNSTTTIYEGMSPSVDAKLDRLLAGQDDLKRGVAAVYNGLTKSKQQTVDEVLAGLRAMRLDDAESAREMRGMLDAIRRGLIHLQSRQLPELSAEVRSTLKEVTEVVRVETDVKNGLEWTIPLIPALLNYKINVDLGGGLDLRQWWENLLARIRRR